MNLGAVVVTVVWVFQYKRLGSLTRHRPSPLAVLVLFEEEA